MKALWSSGFRPFFLLGACYGPLALALNLAARAGHWPLGEAVLVLGHAHEMLYGFATATACGVLLTALPSWTGAADDPGRTQAPVFVDTAPAPGISGWQPAGAFGLAAG